MHFHSSALLRLFRRGRNPQGFSLPQLARSPQVRDDEVRRPSTLESVLRSIFSRELRHIQPTSM